MRKRVTTAASLLMLSVLSSGLTVARAQLLGEPPIPPKEKKQKRRAGDLEWLWQYSPPPAEGREHELIQDPHFHDFLEQYFTAPQSFWGPHADDPQGRARKSLPETIDDYLTIPGQVIADENRYITATGSVFHRRTARGLLFADLNGTGRNGQDPLVAFAALDWVAGGRPTTDPEAEYTLWIFADRALFARPLPGSTESNYHLPPPLERSIVRWLLQPVPGTDMVQKIRESILVDPDGTPHKIPTPGGGILPATEAPTLPKRPS